MLAIIKKMFMGLLISIINISNHTNSFKIFTTIREMCWKL